MYVRSMPPTGDLIGSQEAATILGWGVRRVNRAALTGELPLALQVPGYRGANLFHRADVERHAALLREAA